MGNYNLKLKLKSELKIKMPSYVFNELVEEVYLSDNKLNKNEFIELLFEKYTLEEIKDIILHKYDENESFSNYKEKFLNTLNRLGFDERDKLERKRKKEKRIKKYHQLIERKRAERELERIRIEKENLEIEKNRHVRYPLLPNLNIYHTFYFDIYFLYDYIRQDRRDEYINQGIKLSPHVEETLEIDDKLIDYKDYDTYLDFFSQSLFESIKNIYKRYFLDKDGIALLSVPSSKTFNDPQTEKSIIRIEEWCEMEENSNYNIYNYSDLLIRNKTVESSKSGNRSIEKHLNSIIYNEIHNPSQMNVGLIILDDITTSGNTMKACRDILIENGHKNKDIVSLVIARTVNVNTDLIKSDIGVIIKDDPYKVERFEKIY